MRVPIVISGQGWFWGRGSVNLERVGDFSREDRMAAVDALHFLQPPEFDLFLRWSRNESGQTATAETGSQRIRLLKFTGWQIECRDDVDARLAAEAQRLADMRRRGSLESFALAGDDLLVLYEEGADRSCGHIIVISPEAMAWFLKIDFPEAALPPALLRAMTCFVAGLSPGRVAALNGKSVETIKSQSRELRRRLGLERTDDIARIVGTRLALFVDKTLDGDLAGRNLEFAYYVRRYLPQSVRTMVLLDEEGRMHRFLDMGPRNGIPLICLHPMILSDFQDRDMSLLGQLGLRLLWPLRNGLVAPTDPILSETGQIRHACKGIEMAARIFVDGRVSILSFNASSKVALDYARTNPEGLAALFFAGVCVPRESSESSVRRLGRGMISLASRNRTLLNATMEYLRRHVLTPDRMEKFLASHFSGRPADRALVERELRGRFGSDRLRDALIASIRSAQHDFSFQQKMPWHIASGLKAEMHFFHGTDDVIHPFPQVETLVAGIPGAILHRLPGAGDLLYHEHLEAILTPIAALLRKDDGANA